MKFVSFEVPVYYSAVRVILTAVLFMTTCVAVADAEGGFWESILRWTSAQCMAPTYVDDSTCKSTTLTTAAQTRTDILHLSIDVERVGKEVYDIHRALNRSDDFADIHDRVVAMDARVQRMENATKTLQADVSTIVRFQTEFIASISVNGVISDEKVVALILPNARAILGPILKEFTAEFVAQLSSSGWRLGLNSRLLVFIYTLFCLFKSSWKSTPSTLSDYKTWFVNLILVFCPCEFVTRAAEYAELNGGYFDWFMAFVVFACVWACDGDCNAFWTHPIVNGRRILAVFCRSKPAVAAVVPEVTAKAPSATIAAIPTDTATQHTFATNSASPMSRPVVMIRNAPMYPNINEGKTSSDSDASSGSDSIAPGGPAAAMFAQLNAENEATEAAAAAAKRRRVARRIAEAKARKSTPVTPA